MKRTLLIFLLLFSSLMGYSQENALTLSGGYAFTGIEDEDDKASGFRINVLYEFIPNAGTFSHGVSLGYIGVNATIEDLQSVEYKFNAWPIYYAPKVMFGNNKFKGFVKGAVGMHFSNWKRTAALTEIKTNGGGFYGGLSGGLIIDLNEKMFLNAEYEWAYMSNTVYTTGFMNTAMLGIGMRF